MGNSSQKTETTFNSESTIPNLTYITSEGVEIDMENHSQEFFEHLELNIDAWIKYAGASPDFFLTPEEKEYIQTHMVDSEGDPDVPSGILTRVEKARHFTKHDYKVGDVIDDPATLRSYSRNQEGTLKYIQEYHHDPDRDIVLYRTKGNVKHFNASRFDQTYEWEAESFVEQGKMKITNINRLEGGTLKNLPTELGLDFNVSNLEQDLPRSIIVVELEQL